MTAGAEGVALEGDRRRRWRVRPGRSRRAARASARVEPRAIRRARPAARAAWRWPGRRARRRSRPVWRFSCRVAAMSAVDVRGVFDRLAGVVAARVARDLLGAVDEPDGGRARRAASAGAGRACAESSSCSGRSGRRRSLPETTARTQRGLEGMRRQRQQPRLLVGEDGGDGAVALLGMRPLMRELVAPAAKLRVEIVDIAKGPRREEGVAEVLDLPLDLPLLIPARRRARPDAK